MHVGMDKMALAGSRILISKCIAAAGLRISIAAF